MRKRLLLAMIGLSVLVVSAAHAEEPPKPKVIKPLWNLKLPPHEEPWVGFGDNLLKDSYAWCAPQIEAARKTLVKTRRPIISPYVPVPSTGLIVAPTILGPYAVPVGLDKGLFEFAKVGELYWMMESNFGMTKFSGYDFQRRQLDSELPKGSSQRAEQIFNHTLNGTGAISSDRFYFVDDRALYPIMTAERGNLPPRDFLRHLVGGLKSNELRSVALDTGKLMWKIASDDDRRDRKGTPNAFRETIFLGAPLVTTTDLFILIEKDKELSLVALDTKYTFRLEEDPGKGIRWQTQLLAVPKGANEDFGRRIHALNIVAADKLLLCPTHLGALVAVDRDEREVAWTARYAKADAKRFENYSSTWQVAPPLVVGKRVLYAPPDADALFAFNLTDGKEAWKIERGDGVYLAGLHEGKAIIVESNAIRAVNAVDGKEAWKVLFTGILTGRGVMQRDLFFLPHGLDEEGQEGQISLIDLKRGKLTSVWKPAEKQPVGNLIIYKNKLISQSFEALSVFDMK